MSTNTKLKNKSNIQKNSKKNRILELFDNKDQQQPTLNQDAVEHNRVSENKKNIIEQSKSSKSISNDSIHKQSQKISTDFNRFSSNVNTQANINKLQNVLCNKEPCIILQKIDCFNNGHLSNSTLQTGTYIKSNVNDAKRIRLATNFDSKTNLKVTNKLNMSAKEDLNVQVKKQPNNNFETNSILNTFENCNAHMDKFIKDPIKQLKFTLLLINEKLMNNYYINIPPEVNKCNKIYDKLFCFEKRNPNTNNIDCNLCVSKYLFWKQYDTIPTINYKMLGSSDFNIEKYYDIYCTLDKIYSLTTPVKKIKNFFIYTNLELNFSTFDKKEITILKGSRPDSYKLVLNENNAIFQNLSKKFLILPELAKQIAEHMLNKETVGIKGLMKKYHVALIYENVIEIQIKIENGKKKFIGKFHQQFIKGHNLSGSARDLRKYLEIRLGRAVSEDMELNLSANFGTDFSFNENPQIDHLNKLATELVVVISSSINMPKEKILFRKYSTIKDDIMKITGHVLEKGPDGTVVFTNKFLNYNTQLPGNLNILRNLINFKLREKNISFNQITHCRLKINEFRDRTLTVKKLPRENHYKIIIREFFNKLEFVVNKTDVDNRICNEIGKEFTLVQNESHINLVEQEFSKWLKSKNYDVNLFQQIKYKISKYMIINRSIKCNTYSEINIHFQQECIQKITKCLNDNEIKFINIKTNCMQLSKQKVHQVVKGISKYSEDEGCIFINYNTLITETHHVLNAFKSLSTNLLVIEYNECRPSKNVDHILDIFYKLKNIIDVFPKKILIIGNAEDLIRNLKVTSEFIIDVCNNLKDLTQDSQTNLLENIDVQLHRCQFKLLDLMDNEGLMKLITTSEMLTLLIKEKFCVGKELLIPRGFDSSCYIRNQVSQNIIIKPAIFKKKINDIFIIIGIKKLDFSEFILPYEKVCYLHEVDSCIRNVRFILVDQTYEETSFDKLAEKKEINFHLIKYESKKFFWKKSSRSISVLFEYRDNTEVVCDIKLHHELNVLSSIGYNQKMIIVTADVGAGKSVYLYNLAMKASSENCTSPLWLVQINLSNITFLPYKNKIINDNSHALHIISELLKLDKLQQSLFILSGLGMLKLQVAVLFDGFDELLPNQMSFMTELLKHLNNTYLIKVFVTVRPDSSFKLEKELDVFSYRLNSFTHDEKVDFLVKYWTKKFEVNENKNKLHEYAECLLSAYSENSKLALNPLQLKLLAKIHAQCIQQKTLNSDFTAMHIQDYYDMYSDFIDCQNYDNMDLDDIDNLQKNSLKRLLSFEEFKRFGFENEKLESKKLINIPEFYHITFAEYFAAHWLVDQCNNELLHYIVFDCIDRLIVTTSSVFLDTFAKLFSLNSRNQLQSLVTFLAQSGHINLLKTLINHSCYDDSTEKTALHIAAETNNLQVLRILLSNCNDLQTTNISNSDLICPDHTNSKLSKYVNKNYQGKNALQMAENNNNVEIACDLLLAGADIKLVNKEFLQMVVLHVLAEISVELTWSHKLWPLAERLLKIVPKAINQFKNEAGYSNLLNYFFAHGRIGIIKTLFQVKKTDTYELMIQNTEGMTPLDYINNSTILKDDERLEVSKFLIEEIGLQFINQLINLSSKKNKNFLYSILFAAIKFEHTKTFEYFIDQYPDSYIGFLKFALQTNNIQILEFLMRNNERTIDPLTGNTALQTAVHLGVSPRIIKFLVDKGGINSTNNLGENVLCVAIKAGVDFKIIKYLVKQGANINTEDKSGLFPWCYAILSDTTRYNKEEQLNFMDYLQTVRSKIIVPIARNKSYLYDKWRDELVKKYEFFCNIDTYDLNCIKKDKSLRLHVAIKSNDLNWSNFLIDQGADIDIQDKQGRTSLHIAIENNRYDAAKLLLQNGAIFDIKDKGNKTPLDLLANTNLKSEESQELYDILKKASLFFSGKKLSMLLKDHLPVGKDDLEISWMRYLIACRNNKGQSLLHVAAATNSGDVFKQLLKFGVQCSERYLNFRRLDINIQDFEGNTPMHLAASKGYQEFIVKLINEGACFEIKNNKNSIPINVAITNDFQQLTKICNLLESVTILFKAVKKNDFEVIKSYLNLEPLILNARDVNGMMLLHWAVKLQENSIAEYLIRDKNSKVSAPDFNGRTPLHYAVEVNNIECVKSLLKAGAKIDAKDKQGQRAFDLRNETNKSADMLKKIYRLFDDVKNENPNIILNEEPKIFIDYLLSIETKYQIDRDIVINTRECNRNSLFHYIVKFDYISLAVVLLKNGAVYNSRNQWKQTPIDFSKSSTQLLNSIDTMFTNLNIKSWKDNRLVDREIFINCRGIGGYTLLHSAVKSKKIEEVKWLLEQGASRNVTNNKGSSALSHAQKNCVEIANVLMS